MKNRFSLSLLCFLLPVALGTAQATEFNQVQADKSNLGFVSRQMGVPVEGWFHKFTATIAFDPARANTISAQIELDLASIDVGSREANDEVVGKQWFNVKAFPGAKFVATGVRPLGGGRYDAAGKLTIKGKTQDVTAPFTFRQEGAVGVFDGGFTLKRLDYGIGEGPWADVGTVANEIQIRFHVVAGSAQVKK